MQSTILIFVPIGLFVGLFLGLVIGLIAQPKPIVSVQNFVVIRDSSKSSEKNVSQIRSVVNEWETASGNSHDQINKGKEQFVKAHVVLMADLKNDRLIVSKRSNNFLTSVNETQRAAVYISKYLKHKYPQSRIKVIIPQTNAWNMAHFENPHAGRIFKAQLVFAIIGVLLSLLVAIRQGLVLKRYGKLLIDKNRI